MTELPWLYAGLAAYALAMAVAYYDLLPLSGGRVARHVINERIILALMFSGVLLLVLTLAERWQRLGHGPFVNLFELLISQLFSLGVIYGLVYWRVPAMRRSALVALPLLWVLGLWVLLIEPTDSVLPPTYHNNWLWAHVGFGKVFLSCSLVGSGLAGVILLRPVRLFQGWFRVMPLDKVIDALAWRFMLIAFVFHTLMLVAGAVWAQDAWGRYWAWDALETSSFLNWLLLGASLHARVSYKISYRVGAMLIFVVFIFAFLTYFGTPFYSDAAHKGVI